MRVALLTSANGWRGSGASYAKIARGLSDRGHVAHLVTAVPEAHRPARARKGSRSPRSADGTPARARCGRSAGRSGALGAQAIVADTPRDVRLSFYATLVHRARILYRYNLNYRRPAHPPHGPGVPRAAWPPACISRASSRMTPSPTRDTWRGSRPTRSPTVTTPRATLRGRRRRAPSGSATASRRPHGWC